MHLGDITGNISLNEAITKHTYGLGALEGLKGEILILDNQPIISKVVDNQIHISNSTETKASLLVYSYVDEWKSIKVPDSVRKMKDIEELLGNYANSEPFSFIIEGKVKDLSWHVIDWVDGDNIHTPEKHQNSGLKGVLNTRRVIILGFFSRKHQGVFTHHSSNMHIHFVTDDKTISGHVDDVEMTDDFKIEIMK